MIKSTSLALSAYLLLTGFCWANPDSNNGKSVEQIQQDKRTALENLLNGREYLSRDGRKEAEADISSGKQKFKTYGRQLAPEYEAVRDKVFFDRFGVQHEAIAGCMVNEPLVTYAKAYNKRIQSYVAEKYGNDTWAEAEREAFHQIEAVQRAKNTKAKQ